MREAVVIAREDTPGDKRLVAYYTTQRGERRCRRRTAALSSLGATARVHGAGGLCAAGVAAADAQRQAGPQGAAAPETDAYSTRGYEPPAGRDRKKLAAIWAEVLKLDRVGRHDNFFALGGHSLLAVRVVTRLQST